MGKSDTLVRLRIFSGTTPLTCPLDNLQKRRTSIGKMEISELSLEDRAKVEKQEKILKGVARIYLESWNIAPFLGITLLR